MHTVTVSGFINLGRTLADRILRSVKTSVYICRHKPCPTASSGPVWPSRDSWRRGAVVEQWGQERGLEVVFDVPPLSFLDSPSSLERGSILYRTTATQRRWNCSLQFQGGKEVWLCNPQPKADGFLSVKTEDQENRLVSVGGGFRIGNTCTPVADSCWCMAKPIQYCKVKKSPILLAKKCN